MQLQFGLINFFRLRITLLGLFVPFYYIYFNSSNNRWLLHKYTQEFQLLSGTNRNLIDAYKKYRPRKKKHCIHEAVIHSSCTCRSWPKRVGLPAVRNTPVTSLPLWHWRNGHWINQNGNKYHKNLKQHCLLLNDVCTLMSSSSGMAQRP